MTTCIVIPARKGSKGLPGKNTRLFRGFPLVDWSLASGVWLQDRIPNAQVIASSDDPEICALVHEKYATQVTFRDRDPDLASDVAGMAGVVLDAAQEADQYILLQPTTPLRLQADLAGLLAGLSQTNSVASCTEPFEAPEDVIEYPTGVPIIQGDKTTYRQARDQQFGFVDGAFYAGSVSKLRDTNAFLHPDTLYYKQEIPMGADIDTAFDWAMTEALHDWLQDDGVSFVRPNR
ncbi:cytidylyltransferase domain-containing protein [Halocynthiibacter namhaensis]|uniref:acylneuraminate cytidylyltransferase family protein n=1 Tax=Halocynthiibacter namhaensis TaxID=1290553 RepID=UPI000691CC04|nr:hypothetical protein [Halocynthiibacter namhaensis]